MHTLKTGILAYFDTFAGMIPCKVLQITGRPGIASSAQSVNMKKGQHVTTPDGIGTVVRVSPWTGVMEIQIGCISAWYNPSEVWPINEQHTQRTQQAELFV